MDSSLPQISIHDFEVMFGTVAKVGLWRWQELWNNLMILLMKRHAFLFLWMIHKLQQNSVLQTRVINTEYLEQCFQSYAV